MHVLPCVLTCTACVVLHVDMLVHVGTWWHRNDCATHDMYYSWWATTCRDYCAIWSSDCLCACVCVYRPVVPAVPDMYMHVLVIQQFGFKSNWTWRWKHILYDIAFASMFWQILILLKRHALMFISHWSLRLHAQWAVIHLSKRQDVMVWCDARHVLPCFVMQDVSISPFFSSTDIDASMSASMEA